MGVPLYWADDLAHLNMRHPRQGWKYVDGYRSFEEAWDQYEYALMYEAADNSRFLIARTTDTYWPWAVYERFT